MKKIVALSMCLLLMLAMFAGCASTPPAPVTPSTPTTPTTPTAPTAPTTPTAPDYPTKPIQVIIPYAPGGGSDILTRAIMQYIELPNKQNLVAVNVEGAAGFIGAMQGYNSNNDGYFILAHNPTDIMAYSLSGQSDIALWSELEYVCGAVMDYDMIAASTQSGLKSIEDVVAYANANPGKLKIGAVGSLTVGMANTIRILESLGIEDKVTAVPYDGGAPAKTALMGNHIQLVFTTNSDIRTAVESGDALRILTVAAERPAILPDIPCTVEKGIPVDTAKPRAYYAPKGTPQEHIDVVAAAMKKVIESPEFDETVSALGLVAEYTDGKELKETVARWVEELTPVFERMTAQ